MKVVVSASAVANGTGMKTMIMIAVIMTMIAAGITTTVANVCRWPLTFRDHGHTLTV